MMLLTGVRGAPFGFNFTPANDSSCGDGDLSGVCETGPP